MGAKITIDSATLMNKALEVIEARWLYDFDDDRVDVVVHPQSIVHSMVEFADGSLKAQLGQPDMRIPIQYALTYPAHLASPAPRVTLEQLPDLTFEPPDAARFPGTCAGPRGRSSRSTRECRADSRRRRWRRAFPRRITRLRGYRPVCVSPTLQRFGDGTAPGLDELISLDADVRNWAMSATISHSEASTN